jgi:hypothetical protein
VLVGNSSLPLGKVDIANSAKIEGDLTVAATNGLGDLFFTNNKQGIRFPTFGPTNQNSAMIYMTDQPTSNARMVFAHSKSFSNWGLQYNDNNDQFNFLGNGTNRLAINLGSGRIGIGNAAPTYMLDVTGTSRFSGNVGVQASPNTRTLQVGNTQGSLVGIGTAEYIQDAGASTLSAAADWVPVTDNVYSIGNSSFRWQDVWAVDGIINTSDARDKTNIRDLDYGLKEIMKLHSIKFNWKNNRDDGDKLGIIAQEIKKVLPEVVRDYEYAVDEETGRKTKIPSERLGVMYSDIIPVLINAMQEQQQQIEQLKQQVQILSRVNSTSVTDVVSVKSVLLSDVKLDQNIPNPFNKTTTINYNIPSGAKNVSIVVTDKNGKTMKQIQLGTKGQSKVNIDAGLLSSGTYQYSLLVDGKIIDSKKMVLIR